jgi:hypothetical protein
MPKKQIPIDEKMKLIIKLASNIGPPEGQERQILYKPWKLSKILGIPVQVIQQVIEELKGSPSNRYSLSIF